MLLGRGECLPFEENGIKQEFASAVDRCCCICVRIGNGNFEIAKTAWRRAVRSNRLRGVSGVLFFGPVEENGEIGHGNRRLCGAHCCGHRDEFRTRAFQSIFEELRCETVIIGDITESEDDMEGGSTGGIGDHGDANFESKDLIFRIRSSGGTKLVECVRLMARGNRRVQRIWNKSDGCSKGVSSRRTVNTQNLAIWQRTAHCGGECGENIKARETNNSLIVGWVARNELISRVVVFLG